METKIKGAFIVESLRVGTVTEELDLRIRRISRVRVAGHTAEQPAVWTLIEFEADRADAGDLAEAFSAALSPRGWYVSFDSADEVFVIFAGRVFRYRRDDAEAHRNAVSYADSVGVPPDQCDW